MIRRRWLAAAGALLLAVEATACATLPTSGSAQPGTQEGSGGQSQRGVEIVPVPPGRGWSPIDIVNGFLAASAAFDKHHHAVAHEYLTKKFSQRWRPGWAATIIDSPNVSSAGTRGILNPSGGRPSARVDLTGRHFATLQTAGQDQAGSVVVSPGSSTYQFYLVQTSGGWRIDSIWLKQKQVSPTVLLLTSTDFERDYQPRNLYFYPSGLPTHTLVPDPVYIQQTGPDQELSGLVKALIHPPPDSSWLWHATTTAFPTGTTLLGLHVVGGVKAVVELGGRAAKASPGQRKRMAAQLTQSLTQSPYPTQYPSQIRSVLLEINNRPLRPVTPNYSGWVPRGATSPLYYQVSGVQEPAVSALPASSSTPVPLPLPGGLGNQPFTAMAVSTAPPGPPVIAGCLGRSLYLIKLTASVQQAKKLSDAKLATATKRLPAACTSLSWDDRGNLWVTAQSHTLVLPAAGTVALAKVSLVGVQVLPWLQYPAITSLRVAPDGVRVAMIVGTGVARRILVAAISRNASVTYVGQTQQTLRVGSDIANPVALAWLDPDDLLALSTSSTGRTQMFEVPLNGGESTEVAIPGGVTSVAASWPSPPPATPHVVIGIAPTLSSPGKIEISKTVLPNADWQPLAKGTTPVFPG
jgi:hypothetical protein